MVTKVSTTFILHNQNVRKLKRIFAIALVLFPMLGMAQELKLDTQNATVSFDFVSEGTSGTVGGIDATLSLNWSDLANSSVRGTADVSTLSTKNKMRDKHLKSADYFDAKNFPKMEFKSSSVEKKGDFHYANGTLTIKGVAQSVVFKMEMKDGVMVLTSTINASDYGVSPKKPENSTVNVTIKIPFTK